MSDAAIAAHIVEALSERARTETEDKASLVTVGIEMLAAATDGRTEVSVARRTRTLLFLSAEFRDNAGARIATASSVHKIGA